MRLVYVLIEVGVSAEAASAAPAPVNLGLVVDVSESMFIRLATDGQLADLAEMGLLREVIADGVPAWEAQDIPPEVTARFPRSIDRLQDALRVVVEHLRPADKFSLVAFAGQAETLVSSTPGTENTRLLPEIEKLEELSLGDDTYMGQGMVKALDEIRRGAAPTHVSRMLILTDGFTLDEAECRHQAEAAGAAGVSISTMGLGGEFNEELFISLADQGGGNAYFVSDLSELSSTLAQEFSAAQMVTCRNLELKLRLVQGAELRRAFRVKPVISDLGQLTNLGGSYSLSLGDLERDAPPALLLEIIAPSRPAGVYRLSQLVLAYDPVGLQGGALGEKVRQDVVVQYAAGPQPAPPDPRVMNLVETVSAFKLGTRALKEAEAGDIAGATRKLQAAATRLLDMGEDELAADLQSQAQDLAQEGELDPHATKRLRYETRRLTQKLV
jgi:Ca-activated chloride channel family protein